MVAVPGGRRPGRLGRVQLVAAELAVIAVAAAVFTGQPTAMAVAGVAAVLLLVAACGRSRGRWVYESIAVRRGLRHRRRVAAEALRRTETASAERAGLPRALAALAPDLTVRAVTDRGTAIGVGQDELGWFAAVSVAPWIGLSGERSVALPVDRLARLVADASVPASTVQIVSHSVPAPSARVDAQSVCVRSYQELLGGQPAPADQEVWVAVRLVPRDGGPAAATRGGGLAGVDRALAATLARVGNVLSTAGLDYQILDADGLRQALTIACGVQRLAGLPAPAPTQPVAPPAPATTPGWPVAPPVPAAPGRPGTRPALITGAALADTDSVAEQWACWEAAGAAHVSFAVQGWPAQPPPGLLTALAQVPTATSVDTSVVLRPPAGGGDELAVRVTIRVSAAPNRIAGCVEQVGSLADQLGVRLTRLDGEQAAGVYATAPTGLALGTSPW